MEYSQKPLIELLRLGKLPGETSLPKHIETVISNVFVFEKTVYKIYKNDNAYVNQNFRDISYRNDRFTFTQRDCDWNHTLSPTIYLKTEGVRVKDGMVEICSTEDAEELAIVMNRINMADVLYEKLLNHHITEENAFLIGKQYAENIKKIQTPIIHGNYYHDFNNRIPDLREWMESSAENISVEESGKYCNYLDSFLKDRRELFEGQLSTTMTNDGDIHSHNAVFTNDQLYLIDTFPPKEEWIRGHPHISLYRLGSDIYALSGSKELFEAYLKGCEESGAVLNRELDHFYIIYASGIMISYQYLLAANDEHHMKAAQTYHSFIKKYFEGNCQP